MKKYLDRIEAACGIPDPSEACRVILAIVAEARKKEKAYQKLVDCIEWCGQHDECIGYVHDELATLKKVDCPKIIDHVNFF